MAGKRPAEKFGRISPSKPLDPDELVILQGQPASVWGGKPGQTSYRHQAASRTRAAACLCSHYQQASDSPRHLRDRHARKAARGARTSVRAVADEKETLQSDGGKAGSRPRAKPTSLFDSLPSEAPYPRAGERHVSRIPQTLRALHNVHLGKNSLPPPPPPPRKRPCASARVLLSARPDHAPRTLPAHVHRRRPLVTAGPRSAGEPMKFSILSAPHELLQDPQRGVHDPHFGRRAAAPAVRPAFTATAPRKHLKKAAVAKTPRACRATRGSHGPPLHELCLQQPRGG